MTSGLPVQHHNDYLYGRDVDSSIFTRALLFIVLVLSFPCTVLVCEGVIAAHLSESFCLCICLTRSVVTGYMRYIMKP